MCAGDSGRLCDLASPPGSLTNGADLDCLQGGFSQPGLVLKHFHHPSDWSREAELRGKIPRVLMPRPHCDEHNRKQEREKATLHKSPGALESKLSCLRLLVRAEQGECRMGDRSGFNVVFIKHYQRHTRKEFSRACEAR